MEINEKLNIFYDAAIAAAKGQSEKILEADRQYYQEALEEYEKSRQGGQQEQERSTEEKVRKEVNRTVSEQMMLQKKEYHKERQLRKDELFSMVEEKLTAYQKTEAYRELLISKIKSAQALANGASISIYIDPSDSWQKQELENRTGSVLHISQEPFRGGIRAVIREKNILVDETFAVRYKAEWDSYSL